MLQRVTTFLECSEMILGVECFLSIALVYLYGNRAKRSIAVLIVFVSLFGVTLGTFALIQFEGDAWLTRGLGVIFMVSWLAQMGKGAGDANPVHYEIETLLDAVGIATGYFFAGFVGGLSGSPGPPIIVLVIWRNYLRHDVVAYNAICYTALNWTKALLVVLFSSFDYGLLGIYGVVILGALGGSLIGQILSPFVSQKFFASMIRTLLLCLAIMCLSSGTLLEWYSKFTPLVLFTLFTAFHLWKYNQPSKITDGKSQLMLKDLIDEDEESFTNGDNFLFFNFTDRNGFSMEPEIEKKRSPPLSKQETHVEEPPHRFWGAGYFH